jgi:hypothetical protein
LLTSPPKESIPTTLLVSAIKGQKFRERRVEGIGIVLLMKKCTKLLMMSLGAVQINQAFHLISMTRKSKNSFM